jgi:hypothetical protein
MWADLLIIQQHALLPKALWLKCGCVPHFPILFLYVADDPVAADETSVRLMALHPPVESFIFAKSSKFLDNATPALID